MNANRRLWIGLGALLAISFSVLLWVGTEIHRVMPPIPAQVVSGNGEVLYTRADIDKGPPGLAVHRRPSAGLDLGSRQLRRAGLDRRLAASRGHRLAGRRIRARHSVAWADLGDDEQAAAIARLTPRIRHNGYDKASDTLTVDNERAAAMHTVESHYVALFGDDPALHELRKAYAMKEGTVLDADNRRALTAFIWWSAWAAVTERPGGTVTYTNNWPHEPLVGNTPPSTC
jgi:nitric oxide reductase subunit B